MSFVRSLISGYAVSALISGVSRRFSSPAPVMDNSFSSTSNSTTAVIEKQRVFGTPGASLFTANLDPSAVQAGIKGEQVVGAELERIAAFYPNTYVFHSVKLHGKVGDIDHLVVQGNRMLLVDTKNWKQDASYYIFFNGAESDSLVRDDEEFAGGEVHLTRQLAEWQTRFMSTHMDIDAVLVIANRISRVSNSVTVPYAFTNLNGLPTVFENMFASDEADDISDEMLKFLRSMVQDSHNANVISRVIQPPKAKATRMTKWLVVWSILNYVLLPIVMPLAGVSAVPLLVATYRHKAYVKAHKLGGGGLLNTILAFTYLLIFAWLLTLFIVVFGWMSRPV